MTEPESVLGRGFSDVTEQAQDPAQFFRILDMQAVNPAIIAMRERARMLLAPTAGGRYLDVGCGTGEVARAIATETPGADVVGIDASPIMIAEAKRRTLEGIQVTFDEGDAMALAYPDDTFDGAHCERVLQHLPDPARAFAELVRVVRPGGRVVVADTDWETAVLSALDPEVDRRLRVGAAQSFPNGLVGRHLFGLAHEAGLVDRTVEGHSLIFTDWDEDRQIGPPFGMALDRAAAAGAFPPDVAAEGRRALQAAAAAGTFFCSVTIFLVSGRVP